MFCISSDKSRVACYIRLAWNQATSESDALIETKKELLKEYCVKRGLGSAITFYTDIGWSGVNMHRPELRRMLKDIKARSIDVCVVDSLSRLSRNSFDILYIYGLAQQYGVVIASVKEGVVDTTVLLSFEKLYKAKQSF